MCTYENPHSFNNLCHLVKFLFYFHHFKSFGGEQIKKKFSDLTSANLTQFPHFSQQILYQAVFRKQNFLKNYHSI